MVMRAATQTLLRSRCRNEMWINLPLGIRAVLHHTQGRAAEEQFVPDLDSVLEKKGRKKEIHSEGNLKQFL